MGAKILFIDGNRPAKEELCQALENKGYTLSVAHSGKLAVQQATHDRPDLIILDATSPRLNSKRLSYFLYHKIDAPIIAIISKRMIPFEFADEQVTNPVNTRQFIALTKRVLKLKHPWILKRGELSLDLKKRTITRGNSRPKRLRPMEARLIKTFMQRPNEIISRAELMKLVWDTDFTGDTRTLDVHIRWVRERVEENPSKPKLLRTVRGQGYRLEI